MDFVNDVMRINVFEFEDFDWFPDVLRRGMMDYLRYFFTFTNYYGAVTSLVDDCLDISETRNIIDLCSGGGGPVLKLQQDLSKKHRRKTHVFLTDLYPNRDSCRYNKKKEAGDIRCINDAVDATSVPTSLKGFRTIFSSIHHFNPEQIKTILTDAYNSKQGIGIFDIGDKNLLIVIGILILHPILLLLLTPFIRPFRFTTIIFTYLIPLIPFFTVWDGIMSILRLYSPNDLQTIVDNVPSKNYHWHSGKIRNRLGLKVTYVVGVPVTR